MSETFTPPPQFGEINAPTDINAWQSAVADWLVASIDETYGRVTEHVRENPVRGSTRIISIATGGWSDNEHVIGEIPSLFRALCWQASVRGGLHIFHVKDLG